MAAVHRLRFGYSNFLTVWTVKRRILHNRAKFREDRSIRYCDIAIFLVFTARCYASAVLAMGLCLCLCLSVCLSQVGVLL